jgi:hypothetical protein
MSSNFKLILILFFIPYCLFSQEEDSTLLITPCNCIQAETEFSPCLYYDSVDYCGIKQKYEFRIFNRWGEILFESFDQTKNWIPDENVTDGTYIWQIKGEINTDDNGDGLMEVEKVKYQGHITLLK